MRSSHGAEYLEKQLGQSREELQASHEWIMEHGGQYRGLWLAVSKGKLLGTAARLDQLKTVLDEAPPGVLIAHMPSDSYWYEGVSGHG